jgi:ribonuclease HI
MDPASIRTFGDLLRFFRIPKDDWDAIIITDGSGTTHDKAIGWGAVLIENLSFIPQLFHGGKNHGTNNVAEVMAVLDPLSHLVHEKRGVKQGGYNVHVITDSEYVVNGLNQNSVTWAGKLASNREWWMAIQMTKRRGLIIKPHHILRDTIDYNRICHDLANLARRSQINLTKDLEWDIREVDPTE